MKQKRRCQYEDSGGVCGMVKSATRHFGLNADHEYQPEARAHWGFQRAPIKTRSDKPNRTARRDEGDAHAREHRSLVKHCEAPDYGITTPCGTGLDSRLDHSHNIGKGMGGGKDYAVSDWECAMLCRKHHRELDTNRADFRVVGLSKKAPPPAKVVPRRRSRLD